MYLGIVARTSRHGITSRLLKWFVVLSFPAFFRFTAGLGSKAKTQSYPSLEGPDLENIPKTAH